MRLTKYEPNDESMFPYKLKDEELSTELDSIHKLGEAEDILEKHNVSSLSDLDNRLVVLETIKEKRVNVEEFIEMFEDWKGITYEEWIIYYEENGYYIQGNEDFDYNRLTKEEFDLLKEELLCD